MFSSSDLDRKRYLLKVEVWIQAVKMKRQGTECNDRYRMVSARQLQPQR